MSDHWQHTLSPECWCDPIIVHVPPSGTLLPVVVANTREADRLAQLGFTAAVVESPDVPNERR
jgi:hypothetical protein